MPSNPQDIFFSSEYPIDKILTNELTATYPIVAGSPGSAHVDTHTVPHSLGKAAFITFAFSRDATNFYAQGNAIRIIDGGALSAVNVDASVDATNVYFYVSNDNSNPQTINIRYVLDNIL